MLGLAEYTASSAKLRALALGVEEEIGTAIEGAATKQAAVKAVRLLASAYYRDMQKVVGDGFEDVAENALDYYTKQAGVKIADKKGFIKRIIEKQFKNKYYGLTLAERLGLNKTRLDRNVGKSVHIGKEYYGLRGLLTKPYPFGAQVSYDKRILLSQSEKIEQDIAKEIADVADIRFIRWTLSKRHPKPDICDDLASNVSKAAVAIIESEGLDIDPKGLYLVGDLPHPPHPNCMCEFILEDPKKIVHKGLIERSINKVKELIKAIRGK